MLARPADPFIAYNSALSHAERRHKDMLEQEDQMLQQQQQRQHMQIQQQKQQLRHNEQEFGQGQPPQVDHTSSRRKRPLHFEPEFIAALDASLHEPASNSSSASMRSRPSKKPRRSAAPFTNINTGNTLFSSPSPVMAPLSPQIKPSIQPKRRSTSSSSFLKVSDGPSIIDLSSGEELAALHLGENEHKRRRDSTADSSLDSLREVFDVLEDGTLRPIMDHAPALPSPVKRLRTDDVLSNSNLEVLDDYELGRSTTSMPTDPCQRQDSSLLAGASALGDDQMSDLDSDKDDCTKSNRDSSSQMDQDSWMSDDEISTTSRAGMSRADLGALIRYEGPKTMTLANGLDTLFSQRWRDQPKDIPHARGNEMVLYRRPAPTFLSSQDDDDDDDDDNDSFLSLARIEELSDEDVYTSQDSASNNDPIEELEERIMGMDLD